MFLRLGDLRDVFRKIDHEEVRMRIVDNAVDHKKIVSTLQTCCHRCYYRIIEIANITLRKYMFEK